MHPIDHLRATLVWIERFKSMEFNSENRKIMFDLVRELMQAVEYNVTDEDKQQCIYESLYKSIKLFNNFAFKLKSNDVSKGNHEHYLYLLDQIRLSIECEILMRISSPIR